MRKGNNKIINVSLLIIISFCAFTTYVRADSGWAVIFDSASSGRGCASTGNILAGLIILLIVILMLVFVPLIPAPKKKKEFTSKKHYMPVDDSMYAQYNINKEGFLLYIQEKYKQLQFNFVNFDYTDLEKGLNKEIYAAFGKEILDSKKHHLKNHIEDTTIMNCFVTRIGLENNVLTTYVYLKLQQKEYVTNEKNRVTEGDKFIPDEIELLLTFVQNNNNPNEFILSKKEELSRRRVQ